MTNQEINKAVWEYDGILPVNVYAAICALDQIDHIKRDGEQIDLWANDGVALAGTSNNVMLRRRNGKEYIYEYY